MPYRRRGKTIYVFKSGKWRVLKTHPTIQRAIAHLKALKANVKK